MGFFLAPTPRIAVNSVGYEKRILVDFRFMGMAEDHYSGNSP